MWYREYTAHALSEVTKMEEEEWEEEDIGEEEEWEEEEW